MHGKEVGFSERRSLLSSNNHTLHPQRGQKSRLLFLLLFFLLSFSVFLFRSKSGRNHFINTDDVLLPFPTCANTTSTSSHEFLYFGLTHADYDFTIHESISSGNVRGKVHIEHGAINQKADIKVQVHVGSTSAEEFNNVQILRRPGKYSGLVITSPNSAMHGLQDTCACTFVNIVVLIRPRLMIWGDFVVQSPSLSIEIGVGASIETYHFFLSSDIGSIACAHLLDYSSWYPFTAHNMALSTKSGSILGNWTLGSNMSIRAGFGPVEIDLAPYKWSSGPWTQGEIDVRSGAGDIAIRMPFGREDTSSRNYTTNIHSVSVSIRVELVHGSVVNLTTIWGSINPVIMPYPVLRTYGSAIMTSSRTGNTDVHVLPPMRETYWDQPNALNHTKSVHETRVGVLRLRYPELWFGVLMGETKRGNVTILGEDLEDVEVGRGAAFARKGSDGESEMVFRVDDGDVEVRIGD